LVLDYYKRSFDGWQHFWDSMLYQNNVKKLIAWIGDCPASLVQALYLRVVLLHPDFSRDTFSMQGAPVHSLFFIFLGNCDK
jgi:hypothetical protein